MGLRICQVTYPPWKLRDVSDTPLPHREIYELDLDNSQLEEFYQKEMPKLCQTYVKSGMTHEIAQALTDRLMETLFHETDWIDMAYELGYKEEILNSIPYKAKLTNNHPFYFFLSNVLRGSPHVTWGDLVKTFLKMERYDLLEILYPYIIDVTRGNSSLNTPPSSMACNGFRQEWSDSQEIFNSGSQVSSIEDNTQVSFTSELESVSEELRNNLNDVTLRTNEIQRATPITNNVQVATTNITPPTPRGVVSLVEYFKFGKLDPEDITVFISHTYEDYELAVKVANAIRDKKGFMVFVQGDEDASFFRLGEGETVKNMKRKVDFFVPIVTLNYLRQIEITPDSDKDQLLVRYIFYTYQAQFVDIQCVYEAIKPLVPQEVDKRLVSEQVELRSYMILWTQFDRFCKLLRDSKKQP